MLLPRTTLAQGGQPALGAFEESTRDTGAAAEEEMGALAMRRNLRDGDAG